jgi:hypothetical protein
MHSSNFYMSIRRKELEAKGHEETNLCLELMIFPFFLVAILIQLMT